MAVDVFDTVNQYQVAQRNLEIGEQCAWTLANGSSTPAQLSVSLTTTQRCHPRTARNFIQSSRAMSFRSSSTIQSGFSIMAGRKTQASPKAAPSRMDPTAGSNGRGWHHHFDERWN